MATTEFSKLAGILSAALSQHHLSGFEIVQLVFHACSPRDSQESSPTPQFKSINSLMLSFFYIPSLTCIHDYWTNHSLDYTDLCWQSDVSAMLSRLVIAFLPRSKRLLISWLRSLSAVIFGGPKNSLSLFPLFPLLFAIK